jgi:hypothetical protein
MSPIDLITKIGSMILSLVMLYIIFVVFYSFYLYINPNTSRPSTGWYWPDFLSTFVGVGPQSFSVATSNIAVGNDTLGQLKNVMATDCMSNCNITKDCIGFVYDSSANTCTTFTTAPGILPGPSQSNVYYVTGNEPSNAYIQFTNMNITTPSSIPAYVSTNIPSDCAANCAANSLCTGFAINMTTGMCGQSNSVTTTTTLSSVAGTNTYILTPVSLTSLGTPYASSGLLP